MILSHLFHVEIPILEKVIRPILVYFFLVIVLRMAGKRELAQITTFDLVVLLTLSNTVQNAIIGSDNSLLGGMIGAITLLGINALVVRVVYGHPLLSKLLEGEADPLIVNGVLQKKQMEKEGITVEELEVAAHRQGFASLNVVEQATLEAGGSITFIGKVPTEETLRHDAVMARLEQLGQEIAQLRGQSGGAG